MSIRRRRKAVFLCPVLAVALLPMTGMHQAGAQKAVEAPSYRQLGATELMVSPSSSGTDFSANAPSLAGLSLLATIPAPTAPRLGYFIQAQCSAGVTVAFDDPAGSLTPTLAVLAGAAVDGGQGGSLTMEGMPHTGRIRIYSSSASCQIAARSW